MESILAKKYAQVLFDLCQSENMTTAVIQDLNNLARLMEESSDFRNFIESPLISSEKRQRILKEVLKGKLISGTDKFIRFLEIKSRLYLLKEICRSFFKLKYTTKMALNSDQVHALSEHLKIKFNKKIEPEFEMSPEMIGGIKVRIGNAIYDGSIQTQLERFRRKIIDLNKGGT